MASAAKISLESNPGAAPLKTPRLLVEWQSGPAAFVENLRALLFKQKPLILSSRPGSYWADVFVHRPLAKREIALSYLLHALVISIIYMYPWVGIFTSRSTPEAPTRDTTITYYKLSEYLPAITSASEPAKEARSGEPALARQPIVSVPKMPDNLEQTIVDPNNPAVIREHVAVPNMVVMTPIPAAPVAANPGIPKLVLPPEFKVVAPAAEPVNSSLAQMKLPTLPDQQVVQPAPDTANLKMKLSDMSIAQLEPTVAEPQITLTPARALPKLGTDKGEGACPSSSARKRDERQCGRPDDRVGHQPNPSGWSGRSAERKPPRRVCRRAGRQGRRSRNPRDQSWRYRQRWRRPNTQRSARQGWQRRIAWNLSRRAGISNVERSDRGRTTATQQADTVERTKTAACVVVASIHGRPRARDCRGPHSAGCSIRQLEDRVFNGKKYYSMTLNMPNLTSAGRKLDRSLCGAESDHTQRRAHCSGCAHQGRPCLSARPGARSYRGNSDGLRGDPQRWHCGRTESSAKR